MHQFQATSPNLCEDEGFNLRCPMFYFWAMELGVSTAFKVRYNKLIDISKGKKKTKIKKKHTQEGVKEKFDLSFDLHVQ